MECWSSNDLPRLALLAPPEWHILCRGTSME